VSEVKSKKHFRLGFKRWLIIALFLIGGYAAFGPIGIFKPVSPVVVLPGEHIFTIFGFSVTNTILATLLADVLIFCIGLAAFRFYRSGNRVPSGILNAFEAIVEFLWNTVEGAVGNKWGKRVIPVVGTIFILIFVANMVKLVPGFESIGLLEQAKKGTGYSPVELFKVGSLGVFTIDKTTAHKVEGHVESVTNPEGEGLCTTCEVIPFLRGSATDLNFTFALAVIAVVMVQVFGVWKQGPAYFEKFFQFRQLVNGGVFGLINFGVGILEVVLEFAKILSFGFRLFGNIFAGALLLSIVGALTAIVVPPGLYLFEVFFGIIQAYVFFLLATMFISGSLVSHHSGNHGE